MFVAGPYRADRNRARVRREGRAYEASDLIDQSVRQEKTLSFHLLRGVDFRDWTPRDEQNDGVRFAKLEYGRQSRQFYLGGPGSANAEAFFFQGR